MIDLGTVRPGKTLNIPFSTYDSNDPSASVTCTGLAVTDIEIYKDGGLTQRASDAGYAVDTDLDAVVGVHSIQIDLADNTTAGFFAAGSEYVVVVSSITVDAATINFVAARFTIGYPAALLNTTIATLASQTSFTLTDGPAEADALNGMWCIIHDVASQVQMGYAVISDYAVTTKTVTLSAGTTFTAAATDNISIMGPAPALATVCTEARLAELDAANIPADIDAIPTTAMRGTDSAALASVCTEARLAELDAANIPADIDAIPTTAMRGTDSAALASVCTEARLAELDAANIPADIDAIPTTAMRGTDSAALASVCTEARLAELDAANIPADIDAIPTTAMRGTDNAATEAKQDTMQTAVTAVKAITDAIGATAAANLAITLSATGVVSGTASGVPTTTTIPASDLSSAVNDFYNGRVLLVTSGSLIGQITDVSDYDGGTKTLTVTAMTNALAATDTFVLI